MIYFRLGYIKVSWQIKEQCWNNKVTDSILKIFQYASSNDIYHDLHISLYKYICAISVYIPYRMGYALAIGAMPKFMLVGKLEIVHSGLIAAMTVNVKYEKMAEGRRDAVIAFLK